MTDYAKLYADRKKSGATRMKKNKKAIFPAMKRAKIGRAVAHYSGSDDSGMVDYVSFYDESGNELREGQIPVVSTRIHKCSSEWNKKKDKWVDQEKLVTTSLKDAVEELVYDWSEATHPGWENNDGASGELVIDPSKDEFRLEHTSYRTESDTFDYSV